MNRVKGNFCLHQPTQRIMISLSFVGKPLLESQYHRPLTLITLITLPSLTLQRNSTGIPNTPTRTMHHENHKDYFERDENKW